MGTETGFNTTRPRPSSYEISGNLETFRRRAIQRLMDKIDFANSRHKPISLLKQEAKRILELLFDSDAPSLGRVDRDKLTEELLSELMGFGPLEELFRNEKIVEFMILSHDQIISRDRDFWLPVNTKFRDREQYLAAVDKLRLQGEPVLATATPPHSTPAAFDVKLSNGFRVVGICPPKVLELSTVLVCTRTTTPGQSTILAAAKPASGQSTIQKAAVPPAPPLMKPPSRVIPAPDKGSHASIDFDTPAPSGTTGSNATIRIADPFERHRIRITERLILGLSKAGVYDLSGLPMNELRRAIAMYVREFNEEEHLNLAASEEDRLTIEILAAMNRKS